MTLAFFVTIIAVTCFSLAMIYAGVMDVLTMQIGNNLVLFLLFTCVIFAPFVGFSLVEIGYALIAALLVFFFSVAFFAIGWIGGGDAKLATVTAAWMGFGQTFQYLTYAALIGGILTLCVLAFRTMTLPPAWHTKSWVARLHSTNSGVPYGAALALAGLLAIKDTGWIARIL